FNIWERDYTGPLPMCLVWGEDTRKKMARMTDKPVVAVGPPIHYAVNAYAPDTITGEKKRLGENALIFPTHSTHLDTVLFDQKHLLSMAHEIKQKFDTVRFCLYWHDVVSGFAKPFLESEFECVTAGHMFDPYFYSRLKALLSVADHSFGNTLGTQSGLSIGMGVPHTIFPQTIRAFSESGEALPTIEEAGLQTCQNLFLGQESVISREQHDFAQQVFGFAFVKKEHEMLALLEQAERMYCAQPR
ncbi:hypothetical protein LJC15_04265, partial [Desulfovibrio sp. OttesenSCG-928-G11]|nr:hypothetical protein [Desulfovibrio sp. OttesenSCG-928-G11]